jgi:monovalent cation/hydrogen antiporter
MGVLELIILIGAAVMAGEVAARYFRLPPPLMLLAIGSGLSFVPALGGVGRKPDVVLFIFVPAIVYWESQNNTSLREIRDNLRIIAVGGVGLVLATAFCVAAVASALGLAWPSALVLGAIVSLTDVRAMAGLLPKVPRRVSAILRAESVVNDGTALVLYSIAVSAAAGGRHESPALFCADFAESVAAAVGIGLAVGGLVLWVWRYMTEQRLANMLSLLTPFLAYLPAAWASGSGVVAVATCGIVIAQGGPRVIPAAARRQGLGFWEVANFVLNDILFLLTGLDLQRIISKLHHDSWPVQTLVLSVSGITVGVVIGLRLLWFYTVPYLSRRIDPRPAQRRLRIPARRRLLIAWAGMRGAISLALALALPLTTTAGRPLPDREELITATFAVIAFTIAVQGLSMPAVLRWSRLTPDPAQEYEEALASRAAYQRAAALLPSIAAALSVPDTVRDRLAADYRAEADKLTSAMDDTTQSIRSTGPAEVDWERRLRNATIPVMREAVLSLRRAKRIDDIVLRRIQARLDTEEIRLANDIDQDT